MMINKLLCFVIYGVVFHIPIILADGKITSMNFSGPDDGSHPNIVQIQIEGGIDREGCNARFVAIRNTADRQHLISFALTAYSIKEPVSLVLNIADKYHTDRCTIQRISSVY